jgi:hypothetical protein
VSSTATVPPYLFEAPGTHDAPFTFAVPASLEVMPYTAHATFDGTGASGDFRPCLTFYGVDGVVLGRYFPANVVTAGDVQEVTYTPPFGTAAVSPSSGGVTTITSDDGTILVTNPTGPITNLETSLNALPSIFTTGGQGGVSYTPGGITIPAGGPLFPITVLLPWNTNVGAPLAVFRVDLVTASPDAVVLLYHPDTGAEFTNADAYDFGFLSIVTDIT